MENLEPTEADSSLKPETKALDAPSDQSLRRGSDGEDAPSVLSPPRRDLDEWKAPRCPVCRRNAEMALRRQEELATLGAYLSARETAHWRPCLTGSPTVPVSLHLPPDVALLLSRYHAHTSGCRYHSVETAGAGAHALLLRALATLRERGVAWPDETTQDPGVQGAARLFRRTWERCAHAVGIESPPRGATYWKTQPAAQWGAWNDPGGFLYRGRREGAFLSLPGVFFPGSRGLLFVVRDGPTLSPSDTHGWEWVPADERGRIVGWG